MIALKHYYEGDKMKLQKIKALLVSDSDKRVLCVARDFKIFIGCKKIILISH